MTRKTHKGQSLAIIIISRNIWMTPSTGMSRHHEEFNCLTLYSSFFETEIIDLYAHSEHGPRHKFES